MGLLSPDEVHYQLAHVHDDRSPELYASQIICYVLACIAVALRLISRRLVRAKLQHDDYMIFVALALATGYLITAMIAIDTGAGRHAILLKEPVLYFKLVFSISIIYLVAIAAVKFSILCLYRRIFGIDRVFNILTWLLAFVIFGYSLAGIFVVIFQCNPVHACWDITVPHTRINFSAAATTTAVLNVVTDFLTLALPMPLIWQLQMPFTRKMQMVGIFLLGGFVCIGSVYRARIVHRISARDATWSDIEPAIWAAVEIKIGIVSACLPTMRPVLNWIIHGSPLSANERRASDETPENVGEKPKRRFKHSWLDSLGFTRLTRLDSMDQKGLSHVEEESGKRSSSEAITTIASVQSV